MNSGDFSQVCFSLRPILWAVAIVIIIAAVVWGSSRVLPQLPEQREN